MKTLEIKNINYALPKAVKLINDNGVNVSPRGEKTLEVPGPVATIYLNPCEKVLFDPIRDANPFFHFFESLWILGGRKDVAFLSEFNSNIHNYSDDGVNFHAPYGYRLRKSYGLDQVEYDINLLKKSRNTRQAVMSIWNPIYDLDKASRDIPCNDLIFLQIRDEKLNITVCCRSNDIIWGCYGANVVQFSTIQEYIAAGVGCEVGTYTQVSNSYHAYVKRVDWKKADSYSENDLYSENIKTTKLVDNFDEFDRELDIFLNNKQEIIGFNSIFTLVAIPMLNAWRAHKRKESGVKIINEALEKLPLNDWLISSFLWLDRRESLSAKMIMETIPKMRGTTGRKINSKM